MRVERPFRVNGQMIDINSLMSGKDEGIKLR